MLLWRRYCTSSLLGGILVGNGSEFVGMDGGVGIGIHNLRPTKQTHPMLVTLHSWKFVNNDG